jgi:hypothetical protein
MKTTWFWVLSGVWFGCGSFLWADWLLWEENRSPRRLESPAGQVSLQTQWVSKDSLEVIFSWPGVAVQDLKEGSQTYTALSHPELGFSSAQGRAALPVYRCFLLLPDELNPQVTLGPLSSLSVDLASLGLPGDLLPLQPPVVKLPGSRMGASFVRDSSYAEGLSLPWVSLESLGWLQGQRLWMLTFAPVRWSGTGSPLSIASQLKVTLSGVAPASEPSHWQRLLNKPFGLRDKKVAERFVLVGPAAYLGLMTDWVTAKTNQGFLVTTLEVTSGMAAADIRNLILAEHQQQPLSYLLLVGDTDAVPYFTGGGEGSPPTDLPYACMDAGDDWFPEIAIGRWSVRSTSQLTGVLEKTLAFQQDLFADPSFTEKAVFMASTDNYQITEGTHNYCIEQYLEPAGILSEKLYTVTYNATTAQVSEAFNDGRFLGVYSGHGGTTSWADGPAFSQSDVGALTNTNLYPFVLSFACVTGSYHLTECFTETWLLEEEKAAVGIYGSSVNSYWTEDDILQKELFRALYGEDLRAFSPAWQNALSGYLAHFGQSATTRRYFEMYNLMGDPSSELPYPGGGIALRVLPFQSQSSSGPEGGPFVPTSMTFTLRNGGDLPLDVALSVSEPWLAVAPAAVQLAADGTQEVVVSLTAQADHLRPNRYFGTLSVVNTTNHEGDCTRDIQLTVGTSEVQVAFDMNEDPQWTLESGWAYGVPLGGGNSTYPDPTSGFTGSHVIGYNLEGDYPNSMAVAYATCGPIDCANLVNTSVAFRRWLAVESSAYDHATLEASADGVSWEQLYANGATFGDNAWVLQEFDVSHIADGQSLYLRWGMGPTDGSVTYGGWNLDDVVIQGIGIVNTPACPNDADENGMVEEADFYLFLPTWCQDHQVHQRQFLDVCDLLDVLMNPGNCPAR